MERKNGSLYAFIPKPLEIEEKPELNVFSYNVLIAMFRTNEQGKSEMGSVVYNPDFSTYKKDGQTKSLSYLNIYNHEYRLDISYNENENVYRCDKFKGEERLGIAEGKEWNRFFIQVGVLGLAVGETCEFQEIKSKN